MHRDPQDRTPAYTEPVAQLNTPQSEDEIRSAIASLKASTRATERQTALLNAQNSLADKLNLFPGAQRTQKKGHAWHLAQRENAEVQHVKFAVCVYPYMYPCQMASSTLTLRLSRMMSSLML